MSFPPVIYSKERIKVAVNITASTKQEIENAPEHFQEFQAKRSDSLTNRFGKLGGFYFIQKD